jgi:LAO/AO transport system kinase
MLAKTITLIESALPPPGTGPCHRGPAAAPPGKAVRLGITGVPGVGKSTFIESFGMMLVEKGTRWPCWPWTPAAPAAAAASWPTKPAWSSCPCRKTPLSAPPLRRHPGRRGPQTRETMLVCEAAGFDVMIVETVGVGQSETTVASMVDFFLVLMLAGAGDELQGIKKGCWNWPMPSPSTRPTATMSKRPPGCGNPMPRPCICSTRPPPPGRRRC